MSSPYTGTAHSHRPHLLPKTIVNEFKTAAWYASFYRDADGMPDDAIVAACIEYAMTLIHDLVAKLNNIIQ